MRRRAPDVPDTAPAAALLRRCFAFDATARPTAAELAEGLGEDARAAGETAAEQQSEPAASVLVPEPEPQPVSTLRAQRAAAEFWCGPTAEDEKDAAAIVGRRVRVDGHGAGQVLSFAKSRGRASAHVICLDSGAEITVKLARKGNGKTPWQVWDDATDAALRAKALLLTTADVEALRREGVADPSALAALTDADFGLRLQHVFWPQAYMRPITPFPSLKPSLLHVLF
jgi:hypothetical protein